LHADMAGNRLSQGGLLAQIRPPGWQRKGLPPGRKIHCKFRLRQLTSGAGRYADFLSIGRDLGALNPEADLTESGEPSGFGHDELMVVSEGFLSALPDARNWSGVLDPGPDKTVDSAGWNPALECRERRSSMRLSDLDHRWTACGAANFAADDDPVRGDGDGSVRHARARVGSSPHRCNAA